MKKYLVETNNLLPWVNILSFGGESHLGLLVKDGKEERCKLLETFYGIKNDVSKLKKAVFASKECVDNLSLKGFIGESLEKSHITLEKFLASMNKNMEYEKLDASYYSLLSSKPTLLDLPDSEWKRIKKPLWIKLLADSSVWPDPAILRTSIFEVLGLHSGDYDLPQWDEIPLIEGRRSICAEASYHLFEVGPIQLDLKHLVELPDEVLSDGNFATLALKREWPQDLKESFKQFPASLFVAYFTRGDLHESLTYRIVNFVNPEAFKSKSVYNDRFITKFFASEKGTIGVISKDVIKKFPEEFLLGLAKWRPKRLQKDAWEGLDGQFGNKIKGLLQYFPLDHDICNGVAPGIDQCLKLLPDCVNRSSETILPVCIDHLISENYDDELRQDINWNLILSGNDLKKFMEKERCNILKSVRSGDTLFNLTCNLLEDVFSNQKCMNDISPKALKNSFNSLCKISYEHFNTEQLLSFLGYGDENAFRLFKKNLLVDSNFLANLSQKVREELPVEFLKAAFPEHSSARTNFESLFKGPDFKINDFKKQFEDEEFVSKLLNWHSLTFSLSKDLSKIDSQFFKTASKLKEFKETAETLNFKRQIPEDLRNDEEFKSNLFKLTGEPILKEETKKEPPFQSQNEKPLVEIDEKINAENSQLVTPLKVMTEQELNGLTLKELQGQLNNPDFWRGLSPSQINQLPDVAFGDIEILKAIAKGQPQNPFSVSKVSRFSNSVFEQMSAALFSELSLAVSDFEPMTVAQMNSLPKYFDEMEEKNPRKWSKKVLQEQQSKHICHLFFKGTESVDFTVEGVKEAGKYKGEIVSFRTWCHVNSASSIKSGLLIFVSLLFILIGTI